MTPDELLNDLRDIQLPAVTTELSGTQFSVIPYLLLAFVLLIVLFARIFRGRYWLREARRTLREINSENPEHAPALLDLASKLSRYRQVTPLPTAAFVPPHSIGPEEMRLLYEHLQNIIEK